MAKSWVISKLRNVHAVFSLCLHDLASDYTDVVLLIFLYELYTLPMNNPV